MDGEMVLSEIQALRKQMDDMQQTLNWIVASQQTNSEMVRKSANSISVVIRLLGVQLRLNMNDLSSMLVESEALLETIKQPIHLNPIQLKDNSVMQYKLMLNDLIRAIDLSQKHNTDIENTINHINKQSISTQTEEFHVTPLPNTSLPNQNPANLPQINNNNGYLINSAVKPMFNDVVTNINPIDTNRKKREEEERNRLRRKYNNKYRYLNIPKNSHSIHNLGNTIENIQKNDELPNGENNVEILVVSNDNNDLSSDLTECKTILRSMANKPRVLLNKIDSNHTYSLSKNLKTNVTSKMFQQFISPNKNKTKGIRKRKTNCTKVKAMTRKQNLTKNKRKYLSPKNEKNSKNRTRKNS